MLYRCKLRMVNSNIAVPLKPSSKTTSWPTCLGQRRLLLKLLFLANFLSILSNCPPSTPTPTQPGRQQAFSNTNIPPTNSRRHHLAPLIPHILLSLPSPLPKAIDNPPQEDVSAAKKTNNSNAFSIKLLLSQDIVVVGHTLLLLLLLVLAILALVHFVTLLFDKHVSMFSYSCSCSYSILIHNKTMLQLPQHPQICRKVICFNNFSGKRP